jgi:hypothetical protein
MSTTVNNVNVQFELKTNGRTEYYQYPKMSNLAWVLNTDGNYYLQFTYEDDYFVKIQLSSISNQPGWTNDSAGAEQAVKDVSSWIGTSFPPSGLATEATLQQVLTAVDNMRDYEVRLVEDSTTPNKVTWLEVRYWDAQSGALGTPVYYLPGSTTAGSPVLPISYINDRTLLTQILAELQGTLDVNVTNAVISVSQSGTWTVTANQGTSPWVISGTVNVGNFPATQNVAVTSIVEVEVKNDTGNPLPVTGTVNIGTIPEIEIKNDSGNPVPISDAGGSITVDGAVTVSATNLDIRDLAFATDKVDTSGSTVTVQDGGGSITVDGTVNVGNFPASIEISNDSGNPLPISGSVTISDGSGPVTVDGTITANQGTSPWIVDTTSVVRTPNVLRVTGSAIGFIPAGARSISVYNAGNTAASILGIGGAIAAGEIMDFSAGGENDTLSAFQYNVPVGGVLVFTYIV